MQGESNVRINSLIYLFIVREVIGLSIILLAGLVTAFILHILKIELTQFHVVFFYVSYFVIQLVIVLLLTVLEYKNLKYKIEENALTLKQGVFTIEDETLPFIEIKHVEYRQNIIAQIFSVGQIVIATDKDTYTWFPIDKITAGQLQEAIGNKSDIKPIVVENPQT